MELVKILRELSKRRRLVALVLGTALLVGFLLAFKPGVPPESRQYQVSLATADILIDTRESQVAAVGAKGPDLTTLAGRANLIGNLMTSGPLKDAIAKRAGISPDLLVVVPPANVNTPGVPPAPVKAPASEGIPDVSATILNLTADETLPILHVIAQAPDEEAARRLSGATVIELRRYLGSVAASQHIPAAHQLVVRQFGPPLAQTATRGLPRRYALIAMIAIALLGCATIVGGSWFVRSWRQIEAAESRGHGEGDERSVGLSEPSGSAPQPQAAGERSTPPPASVARLR